MQPVLPSTMVRGPAALTIIFMTRADSQPWQVRCPEVKNSSSGSFFTPLKGSSVCVGRSFRSSAISLSLTAMIDPPRSLSLFAQSDPLRSRLRLSFRGLEDAVGHLLHIGHRDLTASEAADEPEDGRSFASRVHCRAYLGREDAAVVRRAQREVAVDDT